MKTLNLWVSGLVFLWLSGSGNIYGIETAVFTNNAEYSGTDDTFVFNGGAFGGGMSNYGKCAKIEVNGSNRFGLLRFDVSSLFEKYVEIDSVTLRLFSQNSPGGGAVSAYRLAPANSAWREGGNCGGTVLGGNRNEVTWTHLADYGGFPARVSWASGRGGPTMAGVDYQEQALASKDNAGALADMPFDIEFTGDLTELINDWSLASTVEGCRDRGGNPCWTGNWNWAQPAPETVNEGILLRGLDATTHIFHSSEAANEALRPQLIVKYVPPGGAAMMIEGLRHDPIAGEVTLSWTSRNGSIYAIDFSNDLKGWIEFDDGIVSAGESTSFTDTMIDGVLRRFYRVREVAQ
ncbi:MAG: hypothetical protein GY899_06080 [Verrucomicrobiaceae bacterium]|nr:hypothetical protein [Verrucomicrobiaceae bacterium]